MDKLSSFELKLEETIEKLQNCQRDNSLTSCSLCEKFLECDLRSEYVDALYGSMSKGETGGFDFN